MVSVNPTKSLKDKFFFFLYLDFNGSWSLLSFSTQKPNKTKTNKRVTRILQTQTETYVYYENDPLNDIL